MLRALFYRRPQTIAPIPIAVDGAIHLVRIKRHKQARRYTLRVLAATREVLLTIPQRSSVKDAKAFAEKNSGWIAARLRHLPVPAPFSDGEFVPLRGAMHRICHCAKQRGTVWVETRNGESLLCVAGDAPHLHRRVSDYLKREARRDLLDASRRYAAELGVTIKSLTVRDQVSRWGSCSSTGALSFSWRLILAPPYVLDYLAAHEAAHLIEMNHSRKFWTILRGICPELERAKTWLDTHGAGLHRYGAQ
ncbi:MAG TPA: SprT family zinc-dependent metalloprotease [Xanthobacteraceae bacterium]|nr:SprT family zinc-dependent metalloprotease [Xanthobacteraceae bacterium]